ncbi:uncharacterized protein LOC131227519 isoform X1 [Magnolia sinica]|uniref:uncharacterized protein LOC131227519 isoform X1 n=1 Tax=Magnolia sinica TaxID=86752 RepID=UPI00265860F9|nr:uncharacterized protein LOC131227519 isoform X1 [Magnolia sinica]
MLHDNLIIFILMLHDHLAIFILFFIDGCISSTHKATFDSQTASLHTPIVLEFLLHQSEQRSEDGVQLHEKSGKILRCLLSWVRAGCISKIPPSSLPTHPLLNFVFNSLQVSSSFDLAIEVLTELVSRYEVWMGQFLLI